MSQTTAAPAAPTRRGGKTAPAIKKTTCPISRKEFTDHAQPVDLVLNGFPEKLLPREFSTGSLGFNHSGKMNLVINGKTVKCQVGVNITVIGSKEMPKDEELKQAA